MMIFSYYSLFLSLGTRTEHVELYLVRTDMPEIQKVLQSEDKFGLM